MTFRFALGAFACTFGMLCYACGLGPCTNFTDPKPGTCACEDGTQVAAADCAACDGSEAIALGTLSRHNARDSVLSLCDRQYEFEIASEGVLQVAITNATGNLSIKLVPVDGSIEFSATASTTSDANLAAAVSPGRYQLKVTTSSSSSVAYRIAFVASAYDVERPPTDPGDDPGSAHDFGELRELTRIGGFLGGDDAEDYYRFELPSNSTWTIAVTDVAGHVKAQLFADSTLLNESKPHIELDVSDTDVTRDVYLARGVYYVRVVPAQLTLPSLYTFALSVRPYPRDEPRMDPGESKESAWSVSDLDRAPTIGGFVGTTDPEDYYRVTLPKNQTLTYALDDVLGGRVTAQLFEDQPLINEASPDDQISASEGAGAQKSTILAAGTYFVRVIPPPGSQSAALYSLALSSRPD